MAEQLEQIQDPPVPVEIVEIPAEVATEVTVETAVDATVRAEPAQPPLGMLGVLTVLTGVFLSMLDFFIVNVALPTIDRDLGASSATLELVVAGYGIAYALLLVLGGRLGDAFGRRRLFLAGMAAFGVTSLACGVAPTVGLLVAGRVAQGAAAAIMVPQVLATIQATTHGNQRGRALGMYGAAGGVAAVAGQLLGGALVAADIADTGWRAIFLVNVPVAVVGLVLAIRIVPETRSCDPARADLPGTALLGVAVLTLLLPLMEGRSLGWPVWCWVMLGAFPVAAAAFVAVERRLERRGGVPLVPPSLVRVPSMRRGLVLGVPFFAGFGGFMFVFAVALQQGLHFGALKSGVAVVPMAIGFLVTSLATTRLIDRFGRSVITSGAILQAVGLAGIVALTLARWPHLTVVNLAAGMAVAGVGQGMVMSPLFRVVLSQVPAHRAGVGSGVLMTTQQTALALGVATLGSLFLSLAGNAGVGTGHAFATVLSIQALVAVGVMLMSRRLPDPRG